MVLALVMTLSLAVSANALKADEKINEDYAEAVAVLDGMGVFKGYEDGSFKPSGNVTGYEVLAMILRAVGYDQKNEFTGADWGCMLLRSLSVRASLTTSRVLDLNAPATRELVSELLFRSIQVPMVTYTAAFGYQNVGLNEKADNKIFAKNETLGTKNFRARLRYRLCHR